MNIKTVAQNCTLNQLLQCHYEAFNNRLLIFSVDTDFVFIEKTCFLESYHSNKLFCKVYASGSKTGLQKSFEDIDRKPQLMGPKYAFVLPSDVTNKLTG